MSCPLLMNWVISSCKGHERPYVPSLLELEEYCNSREHEHCPVFKGYSRTAIPDSLAINGFGHGGGTLRGMG